VTWAAFPPLDREVRDKKLRRRLMAERAIAAMREFNAAARQTLNLLLFETPNG
jgi:folate-dependent tRNA-U54 methylase TrmFO/GidA